MNTPENTPENTPTPEKYNCHDVYMCCSSRIMILIITTLLCITSFTVLLAIGINKNNVPMIIFGVISLIIPCAVLCAFEYSADE